MFLHGLTISHKIIVKLTYLILTLGMQSIVSNISPPSIARLGMAPTEKSPGRLVGKINWRINEAPEWNEWEKFEVLVSEVKLSVIILYMSYVFHIVSLVLWYISKARLRATRSQDDLPGSGGWRIHLQVHGAKFLGFFLSDDTQLADSTGEIPSRELTYPPKMALLKMNFLFPRWDMLIPWRVTVFLGFSGMSCR